MISKIKNNKKIKPPLIRFCCSCRDFELIFEGRKKNSPIYMGWQRVVEGRRYGAKRLS
ncbi:hypothetical protein ES332_A09G021100v1 [Gossypium tomentosum]|uniref:Uncharacterized protein n=1 Tax=Gossypium tomentosum TaxID=34277 RepID=A0A5D2NYU2_GOSTO|nr:hypothetical protein ES332_A09G021100v1 [Gossypium tomentosum]